MHLKTLLLAFIPSASAHFRLNYPLWRGDALDLASETISEWFYPCAGIPGTTNRTTVPMTGFPVIWNSSHPDALTYMNLGLGDNVTAFNITLKGVYNETGHGQSCLPNIGANVFPGLNLTEGQNASLQVITISSSGASLYNCADITFSNNAPTFNQSLCFNDTGVSGSYIENVGNGSSGGSGSGSGSGSKSGAVRGTVSVAALFAAVGVGAVISL